LDRLITCSNPVRLRTLPRPQSAEDSGPLRMRSRLCRSVSASRCIVRFQGDPQLPILRRTRDATFRGCGGRGKEEAMSDVKPERCPRCESWQRHQEALGSSGYVVSVPCPDPWHDSVKPETLDDSDHPVNRCGPWCDWCGKCEKPETEGERLRREAQKALTWAFGIHGPTLGSVRNGRPPLPPHGNLKCFYCWRDAGFPGATGR